jgi:hypothetical protein
MRVSEIAINRGPELRRVGIHFDDHTFVMETAVRLYHRFGLDLEVTEYECYIEQPRDLAADTMGRIERYTGRMAFNDWEKA